MTMLNNTSLPPIIVVVPAVTVGIIATLGIVLGVILIPIIIINNRSKTAPKVKHKEDRFNEQLSTSTDLKHINGVYSAIKNTSSPMSQAIEVEIEASGNHFYDELINYSRDESDNATQCNNQLNSVGKDPELSIKTDGAVEVTEQPTVLMKLKDEELSENHMYAVLEGPIPPVPERTYKMKASNTNHLAAKEENSDNEQLSQHKIGRRPDTLADVTTTPVDDHEDTCDGAEQTERLALNPNNHTYSVLEGPPLPLRSHKAQSVAVRNVKSPRVKRHSDEQHAYDTLELDTENKLKFSSNSMVENTSNNHHYAVLEGPTLIEHGHHELSAITKNRSPHQTNPPDVNTLYDRLTPKDTQRTTDEKMIVDTDSHKVCATNDSLGDAVEKSGNQLGTCVGHTYDRLDPIKEKCTKANKRKKSVKKKQKHSGKKQTSKNKKTEDSLHIYDVLDFNEIGSEQQEWKVTTPTHVVANANTGSPTISCGSSNINTPHKRKIAHSFSSRTLCDVAEVRTRPVTIHTAASDTNIHTIDLDPEAHIYDTIKVLPVSKRKRKQSGKRYRWLPLKEQLQRQEMMGCSLDQDLIIPPTLSNVTGAIGSSTASISSSHVPEPIIDPCSEANNYAVLDITQSYAQVGPFVPGKRGNETQESVSEENSDYAHLQHH